ncbi:hypothetical protein ATE84_2891 [Aquimarina sp. MAR_2010_214]|uniref:hypothetical protein n=1 Tax=Aquimarina sp. MAR_2010_214 TaxID=1250026 RepID=UPI000CAD25E2|nr:hypothetical protein [Aquimarina sp. MAR_2010_214]PKV50824.1 hypothetical protein ATE84_2891 [Aquimarina sp. MAR_2010_214]
MKTITHYTMMLLIGMLLLSTASITAQKIDFSIKEVVEAFKKETDCSFCLKAFSFAKTIKQIHRIAHDLKNLKPKKKRKKLKRLQKTLDGFMVSSNMEHQGLSEQLNHSEGTKRENTVTRLITLKSYSREIIRLFETSPDLANESTLQETKKHMIQLHEAIGNTLTHLKKQ